MVPDSPTAKQSELVTQYTPFKSFDVPELLDDQLEPFHCMMPPLLPTITPKFVTLGGNAIARRVVLFGFVNVDQKSPFQRRMFPDSPLTQPSLTAVIYTARQSDVPVLTASSQPDPFQVMRAPVFPAPKQKLASAQSSPRNICDVGDVTALQVVPFQRRICPLFPTVHASVAETILMPLTCAPTSVSENQLPPV